MQLKYKRVRSRSTIGIIGNKKHHQSSIPWKNINPENYSEKLSSMLKLFRLISLKIRFTLDFNMDQHGYMVVDSKTKNLLVPSKSKLSLNLNHIFLINMISRKKWIFLCKAILYGLFNLELWMKVTAWYVNLWKTQENVKFNPRINWSIAFLKNTVYENIFELF